MENDTAFQPFRILHLATHTGVYRGGAVQACRMAEGLARRGHEVTLVAAEDAKASPAQRAQDASTWRSLSEKGVRVATLNYGGLFGPWRLRRFIKDGGFDIIHAHRDDALLAAARALGRRASPALVAQRGTISRPPEQVGRVFASDRVRAVVTVARAVRKKMKKVPGIDARKIHVIYGSVDFEKFSPRESDPRLASEARIPEDAYVVGSLSAYRSAKGFNYLIAALDKVMDSFPDVTGLFLGANVVEKVTPMTRRRGNEDRYRIMGHQADVGAWLPLMDVTVVAATTREGLSGVLRESLAAGVPVISTDCAGNREIVRNGETGLLVPIKDKEALRDALLWARTHPDEMRAMTERGRAWVQKHCSIEAQCKRLERVYRSVLE
jgi:glycosyltransferase involved in cell wall biosynthesis